MVGWDEMIHLTAPPGTRDLSPAGWNWDLVKSYRENNKSDCVFHFVKLDKKEQRWISNLENNFDLQNFLFPSFAWILSTLLQMNMDKIKNSLDHILLYAQNLHFKTCVMVKHFTQGKLLSSKSRYLLTEIKYSQQFNGKMGKLTLLKKYPVYVTLSSVVWSPL